MNIQEYIQNGIIQSYVLGLADKDEVLELEQMRQQYPEVEQAIQDFEASLEASAMHHAVPVSPLLKTELFKQLQLEDPGQNTTATVAEENIQPAGKVYKGGFAKYIAAASVALLIASAALNLYTYSKYKKLVAENEQLALQRNQLYAHNSTLQTKLQEADNSIKNITGNDALKITLAGVPGKQGNEVVVYWNKATKSVYVSIKNLPAAPPGKQYQLWALMDGKPIDAGMLGECSTVCKLKDIENAQAFAITLENAGGSPTPTLAQMYVMGKI
ncbi:anti-sigma factor [Niabella soli]|uniref:Anti-sigma K factor RskA C-terminal domain-containing protein n=1 Tax=Niabella soli DSM 19437 TaxID=929713 RepID=W0F2X5_9BACT|nr:anti-sigma factor [Niabella soli]AHF17395.1 hypothetical protein NIASO_06745 [Niabella soli DSM 19437]